MKRTIKTLAIAVLAIGLLFGINPPARAASVTYNWSQLMASTEWDYLPVIPKFNPALGTLNTVKITETVNATASLTATNSDPTQTVTVTKDKAWLSIFDNITGLYVSGGVTNYGATPVIDNEFGYSGHFVLNPGDSLPLGAFVSTNSIVYPDFVGVNVAPFIGGGNLPFQVQTLTQNSASTSGGGQLDTTQNTSADYKIVVEYDYTVATVPEPSTGILLGMGGLLCWSWRRKLFSNKG